MECKHRFDGRMNSFCAMLTDEDRAVLCAECVLREVPRGSMMFKEDIKQSIFIVLSGYTVVSDPFEPDRFASGNHPGLGVQTPGMVFSCDLVCSPQKAQEYDYYLEHKQAVNVAYAPTCLARFPLHVVRELFVSSQAFADALFSRNIEMFGAHCELAAGFRLTSVEDVVKFMLCFGKRFGIEFTHQQMADISGRSRVSISRVLSGLPRRDPEFMGALESIELGPLARLEPAKAF